MSTEKPVAFITGASRGIGKQLAIDYAKAGYNLVLVARSTASSPTKLPGTVDETADLARENGATVLSIGANLNSPDECEQSAKAALAEFGKVDVLINNAAIAPIGSTLDAGMKLWRLALEINVNAPLILMQELCPGMIERGYGRVINISSSASVNPEMGRVSYTTTKRALEGMSEALASELAGTGVSVNAIRLDLSVWSEGYVFTLGDRAKDMDFEDPIVMTDACLWITNNSDDYTGNVVTIADLRELDAVRGKTHYSA